MKSITQSSLALVVFVIGFLSAVVLEVPELKKLGHTYLPALAGYLGPSEPRHAYTTQFLSRDPFMLYIDNFLDQAEISHLLEMGSTLFKPSTITKGQISEVRTSNSCFLRGNDSVLDRVRERAMHFLGTMPFDDIETPQLVRYQDNQSFNLHMDWFRTPIEDPEGRVYNRLGSFFIYLDANCTAGETWFPEIPSPIRPGERSDKFTNLKDREGLAVAPRAGSGVFWLNLDESGQGDERTIHAGLPIDSGSKVGMNIWIKKYVE